MNNEMEKKTLGLPWKVSGTGFLCNTRTVITDFHDADGDERDFTLRAVNNHHALVEALESLSDALRQTDTSSKVYLWKPIEDAIKALKEAKGE